MNFKLHFLDSHLEYFPENLGHFSEEQGKRLHQDLQSVEKIYQGVWDEHILADYCWSSKRDAEIFHKRNAIRGSFNQRKLDIRTKKNNFLPGVAQWSICTSNAEESHFEKVSPNQQF